MLNRSKQNQNKTNMQLLLNTKGLEIKVRNKCFEIGAPGKRKRLIAPARITSIAVTANCMISSSAIKLAATKEIPILFFNRIGKVKARMWSPYFEGLATLRRKQVDFAETTEATQWVISLFQTKTDRQISNLRFLANRFPGHQDQIEAISTNIAEKAEELNQFKNKGIAGCSKNIMGLEGAIARQYWQVVKLCFSDTHNFQKRTRQPALDPLNAMINYMYGMLYTVVEGALFAAGLDPFLGILHADQYLNPTLSYDLIEAFRPWTDRLVFEHCIEKKLKDTCFREGVKDGIYLNQDGKTILIPAFNDLMKQSKQS